MIQKVNGNEFKLKERGPVWKTKIGLSSQILENTIMVFEKSKKWKIKIILN